MLKDVLIIGQGICGTFLSWELERAGLSVIVIDDARPFTASRVAAGLINPVTGRRIVKTWMIDDLLPFASRVYGQMEESLGIPLLRPANVVDFFPTVQMRLAFLERYAEDPQYLRLPKGEQDWDASFHYELGYGMIGSCYLIDLPGLLPAARQRMLDRMTLREERFELKDLEIMDAGIRYRDIYARIIIFCDGAGSFENPYFSRLPFAPNKGEALILDIPELRTTNAVLKKGITLAPWKEGLFWVGSSYEWSFANDSPTETFRQRTEAILRDWLKMPFKVVDHFASVRPATVERRPFVGFHPLNPAVGILNGMGTKGCSLAPYFARQLVEHIAQGKPIQADADVRRFAKILSR